MTNETLKGARENHAVPATGTVRTLTRGGNDRFPVDRLFRGTKRESLDRRRRSEELGQLRCPMTTDEEREQRAELRLLAGRIAGRSGLSLDFGGWHHLHHLARRIEALQTREHPSESSKVK